MSQELVSYIVLGSSKHLADKKEIKTDSYEEFLKLNFENIDSFIKDLDIKIAESKGEIVVLLPPSSWPKFFLNLLNLNHPQLGKGIDASFFNFNLVCLFGMEDGGNKTTISPLDSAIFISKSLMNESISLKFNFKNSCFKD